MLQLAVNHDPGCREIALISFSSESRKVTSRCLHIKADKSISINNVCIIKIINIKKLTITDILKEHNFGTEGFIIEEEKRIYGTKEVGVNNY